MKKEDLKHGMRITCTIYNKEITDAKISIDSNGDIFICQNEIDGLSANDKLGYEYSYVLCTGYVSYIGVFVTNIKIVPEMFQKKDLRTGMRVQKRDSEIRFVFNNDGRLIFTNADGRYAEVYNDELINVCHHDYDIMKIWDIPNRDYDFFNISETGELLWERKEEQSIEELTMEEICKELGREVKIKK